MSLQDFFIYDSSDVSGTSFTSAVDNEQYQIQEVFIIYKTTNQINGKIYVGQHKIESPELSATFDGYLGSGKLLIRAVNKYGEENFYRETLELCYSKKLTDEREIYWIKELSATDRNIGYNIGLGGNGGNNLKNHPNYKEICKKISKKASESHKNHITIYNPKTDKESSIKNDQLIPEGWIRGRSFKFKNFQRKSRIGKIVIYNSEIDEVNIIDKNDPIPEGWILGERPKSKEHLEKIGNALRDKPKSEEHTRKNSEVHLNRIIIYNPIINQEKTIKKDQPIPEGWIKGRSSEIKNIIKNKIWIYNPKTLKSLRIDKDNHIPEGWIKGRKSLKKIEKIFKPKSQKIKKQTLKKGSIELSEKISKRMKENNPAKRPEVKDKISKSSKGKVTIYNKELDIIKRINKDDPIPDGFVLGGKPISKEQKEKIREKQKNMIIICDIINNIERKINKNDPIPDGWIIGRKERVFIKSKEEIKQKQSESRKKYLKEHPEEIERLKNMNKKG